MAVSWLQPQRVSWGNSLAASAACVFQNDLYIFWIDPFGRIFCCAPMDLQVCRRPWGAQSTTPINRSRPPGVCVFNNQLYLFWATPTNQISYSVLSADGKTWQATSVTRSFALCALTPGNPCFWRWADDPRKKQIALLSSDQYSGNPRTQKDSQDEALSHLRNRER
jgi:hypothetical protein